LTAGLALGCSSYETRQEQQSSTLENERGEWIGRLDRATKLVAEFRAEIPDEVANRGECVLVVPGATTSMLAVGGGSGFATCVSGAEWSPPAPIKMSGGTLWAGPGSQSADLFSLITTESAVGLLASGNLQIGTNATAAAGKVAGAGHPDEARSSEKSSEVVSYSQTRRGRVAGATLNEMTVTADEEAIAALYGTPTPLATILKRRGSNQDAQRRFLLSVNMAFSRAGADLLPPTPLRDAAVASLSLAALIPARPRKPVSLVP
jgi:lipid-binding SYLF domain-containing protein